MTSPHTGSNEPWRADAPWSATQPADAAPSWSSGQTGWDYGRPEFVAPPPMTPPAAAPAAPAGRGRSRVAWLAVTAVLVLVAGGVGGVVGAGVERRSAGSAARQVALPESTGTVVQRPPGSVSDVARQLLPSVVTISVSSPGSRGTGSGVVLTKDGYVLTNNHVIAAAARQGTITVDVTGGASDLPATLVGRDPATDLAVIKVDADNLTPAQLGDSASLAVGDGVVAVGSPLGLSATVTSGIVSALNRRVNVPSESGQGANVIGNAIQTDASINPGNSGGALSDLGGRVIGINSAIATLSGGSEGQGGSIGVGFAIPINEARSIAEEIIATGKATHPYVGVSAATAGPGTSVGGADAGARVESVVPSGPSDKAGVQPGDLITKLGDQKIDSVDGLVVATRKFRPGDQVPMTYLRDGTETTVTITLEENPGR